MTQKNNQWHVNYLKFNQILDSNQQLIATCNKTGSLTELQANANMISAVPDLLMFALAFIEQADTENNELFEMAKNAVSKALPNKKFD